MPRCRPLVVILALVGLGLRVWLLFAPAGTLDADNTVPGLMAMSFLRGDLDAFYWGQAYGGSHEAVLIAALFALVGPSDLALEIVAFALSGVSALLIWRIGIRVVGRSFAPLGAGLFWASGPFFIWYSNRPSIYWAALVFCLITILFALRLYQGSESWFLDAAVLGGSLGMSFWANPQTGFILVPVGLLVAPRLLRMPKVVGVAVVSAFLAVLPWTIFNLRNDWASLHVVATESSTYLFRLRGFFTRALPMAIGLRSPFDHEWLMGGVGIVLYGSLLAGCVTAAWLLRRGPAWMLWGGAVGYPFIYALSPYSWYTETPRYLLYLWPVAAIVLADAIRAAHARGWTWTPWVAGAAVVVVAAPTFIEIGTQPRSIQPMVAGIHLPTSFEDLYEALDEADVTHAYADYWVAYRATWETKEQVIVNPGLTAPQRHLPYYFAVSAQPSAGFIFLEGSWHYEVFRRKALDRGASLYVTKEGEWLVVQLSEQVISPRELRV